MYSNRKYTIKDIIVQRRAASQRGQVVKTSMFITIRTKKQRKRKEGYCEPV